MSFSITQLEAELAKHIKNAKSQNMSFPPSALSYGQRYDSSLSQAMAEIGVLVNKYPRSFNPIEMIKLLSVCIQSINSSTSTPSTSSTFFLNNNQIEFIQHMWAAVLKYAGNLNENDLLTLVSRQQSLSPYYTSNNDLHKILAFYKNTTPHSYLVIDMERSTDNLATSLGQNETNDAYYKLIDETLRTAKNIQHTDTLPSLSSLNENQFVISFPSSILKEKGIELEQCIEKKEYDRLMPLIKNVSFGNGIISSLRIDINNSARWGTKDGVFSNQNLFSQKWDAMLANPGMDEIKEFLSKPTNADSRNIILAGIDTLLNTQTPAHQSGILFSAENYVRAPFALLFNNDKNLLIVQNGGKGSGQVFLLENTDEGIKIRTIVLGRFSTESIYDYLPFIYSTMSMLLMTIITRSEAYENDEHIERKANLKYLLALAINKQLTEESLIEKWDQILNTQVIRRPQITSSSMPTKSSGPTSQAPRQKTKSRMPGALPRDIIAKTNQPSQATHEVSDAEQLIAESLLELVGDNGQISEEYITLLDQIIHNKNFEIPLSIGVKQQQTLKEAKAYAHGHISPEVYVAAINKLKRMNVNALESYAMGKYPDQSITLHDLLCAPHFNRDDFIKCLTQPGEINKLNVREWTPLMTAIYINNVEAINLLLAHMNEDDFNKQSSSGTSALMMAIVQAAETGFKDTRSLDRLLATRADPDLEDRDGISARKMIGALQKERPDINLSRYLNAMDAMKMRTPAVPTSSSSITQPEATQSKKTEHPSAFFSSTSTPPDMTVSSFQKTDSPLSPKAMPELNFFEKIFRSSRVYPANWSSFGEKLHALNNTNQRIRLSLATLNPLLWQLENDLGEPNKLTRTSMNTALLNLINGIEDQIKQKPTKDQWQYLVNLTHLIVAKPVTNLNISTLLEEYRAEQLMPEEIKQGPKLH